MAMKIDASAYPLEQAPDELRALAAHWQDLCRGRRYPNRRDIDPAALRDYLGWLNILEVRENPVDYVYRLFGSALTEYLGKDLTGRSVLELPSPALGQCFFDQIEDTIRAGAPSCFRTVLGYDELPRQSGSHRLILPLATDGAQIDGILSYTKVDDAPSDFWSRMPC